MKKLSVKVVFMAAVILCIAFPRVGSMAPLLSDSFAGTIIDLAKWTVIDPAGTNISQNEQLSIANSYNGSVWGQTAVLSQSTFSRTDLVVQAKMSNPTGSSQLLGYGNQNFSSTGTAAYILDLPTSSGAAYALIWENGAPTGSNLSCGTVTVGATYRIVITLTGASFYKDTGSGFSLMCSVAGGTAINNKPIFFQSSGPASTFDDAVVNVLGAPDAVSDLSAEAGNAQAQLAWSAPADNGGLVTDYIVDYRLSTTSTWTTFNDGTGTATTTIVSGLTNGLSYDFRTRAVNSVGTAAESNIVSVTLQAPPDVPGTISGLVYWMDSSDTSTVTITGTSTVTRVTDKSGNFRTATASGSASPSLITGVQNGNALLRFNGTSNVLTIATSTLYKTVFVIAKYANASFSDYNGIIGDSTGSTGVGNNSGHLVNGVIATTKIAKGVASFTSAYRNGASLVFSSGYNFSPINEYWLGSFVDTTGQTNQKTTIGQISGGARYWSGDIAEIIVYNTALSNTDRQAVEVYLMNKWGLPMVPDGITDLAASAGNGSVQLSWTAPASNNSSITDYIVDYRLSTTSTWSTFSDGTSASTGALITGLTNGASYDFRARAVNAIGTAMTDSNIVSAVPTSTVSGIPGTISGLTYWMDASDASTVTITGTSTVTQVTDKSGTLHTASASGGASPSYISNALNGNAVFRFNGTSNVLTVPSSFTYATTFVVAKFNGTTFTDYNGLIGDSTGATGAGQNLGHVVNGVVGTTLLSKGGFAFTSTYRNTVSLSFSGGGYDFSPINQYWLGSFINSSGQANVKTTIGQVSGGGRFWNGDVAEVIVYNRVLTDPERQTIENYLASKWNVPLPPDAINDLAANVVNGSVSLAWSAPADHGNAVSDYLVDYRVSTTSTWTTYGDGVSTATSTVISGLANGILYDFRVRAKNIGGTAADSNIPSVTFVQGVQITVPSRDVLASSTVATLSITDEGGSFLIPYIQTSSTLNIAANGNGYVPVGGGMKFILTSSHGVQATQYSMSSPYSAVFTGLSKDTYVLDAYAVDASQIVQGGTGMHDQATSIGIGDIVTAIGDSITEGYYGSDYGATPVTDWTNAPAGSVSTDGRNFPQYGPTSHTYKKSWMTELNNELTRYYGYPVFIMNEGWGGYRTSDYITLMAATQWQTRQQALRANKWLIHLGVNDGFASRSATLVKADLQTIVDTLMGVYGATSSDIFLARPSYSSVYTYTVNYLPSIDQLVASNHLRAGPDFWTYYGNHLSLYGGDAVHPTVAGMTQMARLWALSIMSPEHFSALQVTSTVQLSWNDLSAIDSTIAGYQIAYGTSSEGYTTTTDVGNVLSTSVTGLNDGQIYYFSVSAYDDDAFASNVTQNATETSLIFDGMGPIISSASSSPAITDAQISWATDEPASSQILFGLTASYGTTTAEANTSPRVMSHSVILSGLTGCTTYHYQILSRDAFQNTSTTTDAAFTTSGCAPSAPLGLLGTPSATTTFLSWSTPLDNGGLTITDYFIEYKISSDVSFTTWPHVASTSTSVTITGLTSSSAYDFQVSAVNAAGTGPVVSVSTSTLASDTTPPVIVIHAVDKTSSTTILGTTLDITDNANILAASVSAGGSALPTNLSCSNLNATSVHCTVDITSSGDLYINATDVAGNPAVQVNETGYVIDSISPSAPVATPGTGLYTHVLSVLLTTDDVSATIRYTTDGFILPTCVVGTAYVGSISISTSLILKSVACDAVGNMSSLSNSEYNIAISSGGGGGGSGSGNGGILAHGYAVVPTGTVPGVPLTSPTPTSALPIPSSTSMVTSTVLLPLDPFDLSSLLNNFGLGRNEDLEDLVLKQVYADAKEFNVPLLDHQASAIRNFIVYGISTATIKLGQGERRAMMRDYMETVHRPDPVWSDVERMATGKIPVFRNLALERQRIGFILPVFIDLFGHMPRFSIAKENIAWNVLLYRIRFVRNIQLESNGLSLFRQRYHHNPTTPFGWSVVRVLGYVQ